MDNESCVYYREAEMNKSVLFAHALLETFHDLREDLKDEYFGAKSTYQLVGGHLWSLMV